MPRPARESRITHTPGGYPQLDTSKLTASEIEWLCARHNCRGASDLNQLSITMPAPLMRDFAVIATKDEPDPLTYEETADFTLPELMNFILMPQASPNAGRGAGANSPTSSPSSATTTDTPRKTSASSRRTKLRP